MTLPSRGGDNAHSQGRPNPVVKPLLLQFSEGKKIWVKVDAYFFRDGLCVIGGWTSEKCGLGFRNAGIELKTGYFEEVARPDVNASLGTSPEIHHGFAFSVECPSLKTPQLVVKHQQTAIDLDLPETLASEEPALAVKEIIGSSLYGQIISSGQDMEFIDMHWPFRCHIDHVLRWPSPADGSPLLASGWLAAPDSLDLFHRRNDAWEKIVPEYYIRPDVLAENDIFINGSRTGNGFIFCLNESDLRIDNLNLFLGSKGTMVKATNADIVNLYNYRNYLRAIFSISISMASASKIYANVYRPFLCPLNKSRCQAVLAGSKLEGTVRAGRGKIKASVVIPLYGNLDCLKKQLEMFELTKSGQTGFEVIYVVDDPAILDEFLRLLDTTGASWGFPIRWICGNASQGYAGANNLGASIARGELLIFMNSDVYPQTAAWAELFADFLAASPDVGIAGCRLVYPDGRLQHLYVDFTHCGTRGIWLCNHPYKGLNADEYQNTKPVYADAVTGACVAISKHDFEAAGGWCVDYLLGGYEDIDLCMKVQTMGKKAACLPKISMTHLEHNTFNSFQEEEWMKRLAFFNAVVFSKKYGDRLFTENNQLAKQ